MKRSKRKAQETRDAAAAADRLASASDDSGGAVLSPLMKAAAGAVIVGYALAVISVAVIVPHEPARDPRLTPPDESAHWLFIEDLATSWRLPVFAEGNPNYEAHQPPLYYASVVWAHGLGREFGMTLARLWSALLGGLTLVVAWRIARFLLGEGFWPRLGVVGALAFIPGRVFIVASVSNDSMFELWAALVLLACLRGADRGMSAKAVGALGLCLGLALLTKTSGLVLAPVVIVALVLEPSWRRKGLKALAMNAAIIAGIVGALWGWWVVRNLMLYGEPLATGAFQRVFLTDRATPAFFLSRGITWPGYWALVFHQTWMSLWGVFGQATVYMPGLFYSLGTLWSAGAGVGLLVRVRKAMGVQGVAPGTVRRSWALALLMALLVMAAFVRFNTIFYQAQARYFLGAGVVMAAALTAGIYGLAKSDERPCPAIALVVWMAAMCVWAISAHVAGGYTFVPPGMG